MSNILIVDPNPTMRKTLAENIRGFGGHAILEAESSSAAVKTLGEKKVQVAFLDVEAIDHEETDFIAEAQKVSPSTSIVVVLGLGEDGKKWTSAGAFATVTKPYNIQGMRRIITEAVQNSKAYVPIPAAGAAAADSGAKFSWDKRKAAWIGGAAALLFSLALGAYFQFFAGRAGKVQVYSVPFENLSSIAVSQDSVWVCDWFEQTIAQYSKDGKLTQKKKTILPTAHPSALAWDEKNLWSYSSWEKRLARHKMNDALSVEAEYAAPDGVEIGAFCFGKGAMWLYDVKSSRIGRFAVEGSSAQVKDWYAPIGSAKIIGMYWEEDHLWTIDASGRIYQQTVEANLSLDKVYMLPEEIRGAQMKLAFFIKSGKTCWAGAEGARTIVSFPWKSVASVKN